MRTGAIYDTIGRGYARQRQTDPRIAAQLHAALGEARSVLNVGAGAGSYEPPDRHVVAVEPSDVMIAQRPSIAAPAVRGRAEMLPFADGGFDAVMAVLTIHHWTDCARGLTECARVARERVVLLTFDPQAGGFWLTREFLPEFIEADRATFPSIESYAQMFGPCARVEIVPVPVPRGCIDGFLGAYWARPEAYLDPAVRASISSFARSGIDPAIERLRMDLAAGTWHTRHAKLLSLPALDVGYRLVVADVSRCSLLRVGWRP